MANVQPVPFLPALKAHDTGSLGPCPAAQITATLLPGLFLPPLNPCPKPREPARCHTRNTKPSTHLFNSYLQLRLQNHGLVCLPMTL